jgi:alpha,alpha-trehalase
MQLHELTPLFEEVQMQQIFPDGKTFVDCTPKVDLQLILAEYKQQIAKPGFDLRDFILKYIALPEVPDSGFKGESERNIVHHIESLWDVLTRQPDTPGGSLIPLPFPYIVPGGRFGEIYYWDSYFTMLGLEASGRTGMIENMVKNFAHLIRTIGYIPNGNRTYYMGRSQPPFFSFMVRLLADHKGENVLAEYLPVLETEYNFWMKGFEELSAGNRASRHCVRMADGSLLNRYWDENNSPRPESYREDAELQHQSTQDAATLNRHLRAGAESGWDFSCRWFKDENSFASIHTTEIVPVDLNCLLLHLEQLIATGYGLTNNIERCAHYHSLAEKRKEAIQRYCWNESDGYFFDYDFVAGMQKTTWSLAAVAPLFLKMARREQAAKVAGLIGQKFLRSGGVVTTLNETGQQWDAPNGWAPLQWMTITGLENYGYHEQAKEIAQRWIKLNDDVFQRTGKLMEKYNVVDTHLEAGGGEYAGQDGFGWTNGVVLALIKKYGMPS